jgi:hypothetical protein
MAISIVVNAKLPSTTVGSMIIMWHENSANTLTVMSVGVMVLPTNVSDVKDAAPNAITTVGVTHVGPS